jgi:hypothetical protein
VDRGAGWPGRGYPRPPSTPLRLSTARTSTPQSSSGGRRGRGAGRGRWSEQPVQERDQGDDASLDQEGIPDPDEEVASVDDGGVAGPWLQHWVPPPGCRRPLGLVLPSCSALEQGHHSHRDWDPPGLPRQRQGRYQATSTQVGQVRRAALRSTRSWRRPSASSNPQPSRTQPRCRPADGGSTFTRTGQDARPLSWPGPSGTASASDALRPRRRLPLPPPGS